MKIKKKNPRQRGGGNTQTTETLSSLTNGAASTRSTSELARIRKELADFERLHATLTLPCQRFFKRDLEKMIQRRRQWLKEGGR